MARLQALLALILIAGFFLPWFGGDVTGMMMGAAGDASATVSGFDIVWGFYQLVQEATANAPISFTDIASESWFIWLLAGIPLFGFLTLATGLAGSRSSSFFAFMAGAIPVGEAIYGYLEAGADLFQLFEFGAYLTLAMGVLLVLTAFVPRRF